MNKVPEIQQAHFELIRGILQKHLPQQAIVWVFGSRAKHTAKKFSDLDLLIDMGIPISIGIMAKLMADFEESVLPYKVDIVDRHTISDSFLNQIQDDKVLLWQGSE